MTAFRLSDYTFDCQSRSLVESRVFLRLGKVDREVDSRVFLRLGKVGCIDQECNVLLH